MNISTLLFSKMGVIISNMCEDVFVCQRIQHQSALPRVHAILNPKGVRHIDDADYSVEDERTRNSLISIPSESSQACRKGKWTFCVVADWNK